MKKLMILAAAMTALAAAATDYTWDSTRATGAWNDASNWGGSGYPSASSDKAIFNSAATVTISGGECVGTVSLGADVTIDGGSTSWTASNAMEFGNVEASDYTLTLQNVGFQNIKTGGWSVTINPTVCIPEGYSASIWSSRGGANGDRWYDLKKLTGKGTLYCRQTSGYSGVRLAGDNSSFEGSVIVTNDGSNRMKFTCKDAGSESATFEIQGSVADNGSFNVTGTYKFGELKFGSGAKARANASGVILQVGGKNTDFDLGSNDFNANSPTVRKVGSGTMTVETLQNLGTLQLDAGTTVWTDFDNLPSAAITFRGGTFKIGDDATASDFSSLIANNGTSVYSIDTNGKDLDFSTELPATTGGITKSGDGTLDVDASNVTGTYTVNGGILKLSALPATTQTLVLDGGSVTVVADSSWTEGTITLFNTTATSGITIDETGLPSSVAIGSITYSGSAATVTVTKPELVWKNTTDAKWTDANAWTAGESDATFYDGAAVKFAPAASTTDSVMVDGEVEVASMTIDTSAADSKVQFLGTAGVISGTSGALANAGSLVIGNGTTETLVTIDSILTNETGTTEIKANATLQVNGYLKLQNISGDGTLALGSGKAYNICKVSGGNYSAADANNLQIKAIRLTGNTYLVQNANAAWDNEWAGNNPDRNNYWSETTSDYGNMWIAPAIEVKGDGNYITPWKSNLRLAGGLKGDGTLTIAVMQRGVIYNGDNTEFAGVVTNVTVSGIANLPDTFTSASSGSAHARWVLPSTNVKSENELKSYILNGPTAASPIHFGALDIPNAGTYFYNNVANAGVVIGERTVEGDTDSTLNGTFNGQPLTLVKAGDASNLTLGEGFAMVESSAIIVSNGTLTANCTNVLAAAVTVADGATLAGTGKLGAVAFESGATLAFDGLTADPAVGATINGPTVTSWSGVKPTVANAPVCTKGKWVVKTKAATGDRIQFDAEFVANGFIIIIQ